MGLGAEVSERVDTLSDEVETFDPPLVIKMLKLEDPLEKKLVGEFELFPSDPTLVYDADANDQLAVVSIVNGWQDSIE